MNTLLKKARTHKMAAPVSGGRFTSKDDIELALAWARGEITLSQVSHAYNIRQTNGNQAYCRLAGALRAYIQNQK